MSVLAFNVMHERLLQINPVSCGVAASRPSLLTRFLFE
jgi:hypothetical protein